MAEVHIQAVSTVQAVADFTAPAEEDSAAQVAAAVSIVPEVTTVTAAAVQAITIPAVLMKVADALRRWPFSSAFLSAVAYTLSVLSSIAKYRVLICLLLLCLPLQAFCSFRVSSKAHAHLNFPMSCIMVCPNHIFTARHIPETE